LIQIRLLLVNVEDLKLNQMIRVAALIEANQLLSASFQLIGCVKDIMLCRRGGGNGKRRAGNVERNGEHHHSAKSRINWKLAKKISKIKIQIKKSQCQQTISLTLTRIEPSDV